MVSYSYQRQIEMKKKHLINLILITVFFCFSILTPVYAAIPLEEREVLIYLYNKEKTGLISKPVEGWKDGELEEDGFAQYGTEGKWAGITVRDDHVTKIRLNLHLESLPPELAKLRYLEELYISGVIAGPIPPELGSLPRLKTLNLIRCYGLNGKIPPELGNLTQLENIMLVGGYSGSLPSEIGDLVNLKQIHIYGNLTGSLPKSLVNLTELNHLVLSGLFTGSIPSGLGRLSQLQMLDLKGNFSGPLPRELGQLSALEKLSISGKELIGPIPPELGRLSQLEILKLHGNKQAIAYFSKISKDDKIKNFNAELLKKLKSEPSENSGLTGEIPPELGNLSNLKELSLSFNKLTGSIPPELSNLYNLKYLELNNNQLSGPIPNELSTLSNLQQLQLQSNNLSGMVPPVLINLRTYLWEISYNSLSTDNSSVQWYLDHMDAKWLDTQTIPPSNLKATALSPTSVKLTWTPIRYQKDKGGYHIFYVADKAPTWEEAGVTNDKKTFSFVISDLQPNTKYFFRIQTRTDPHPNNTNTLFSDFSREAMTKTLRQN